MGKLSNRYGIIMTAMAALLGANPAAAVDDAPPPHALILFGANWCAPCLAELRSLPAWGAAVNPAPVLLAWTDGQPPKLWQQWPANARLLPLGESAALLKRIGGKTAGLPYVAMLDGAGRLCADLRGQLNPARLEAMKVQCRR